MLGARKKHKNYRGLGHILPLMKELNTNIYSQYCPEDFIWFLLKAFGLRGNGKVGVKLRDSLQDKPLSLYINAYCVHVWAFGCRQDQKDIEGQLERSIPTNCVNLTEGSCLFYPRLFWNQKECCSWHQPAGILRHAKLRQPAFTPQHSILDMGNWQSSDAEWCAKIVANPGLHTTMWNVPHSLCNADW